MLLSIKEHNEIHKDDRVLTDEGRQVLRDKMTGNKNPYYLKSDTDKFDFASHTGDSNGRWIDISNDELLDIGNHIFVKNKKTNGEYVADSCKRKRVAAKYIWQI